MPKTILLVEDSANDIELILHSFKKYNIFNPVKVVHDGAEALDYLFGNGNYVDRKQFPLPVVVLLDIKLPKINGLEVLQKLRANPATRSLPVIMLTSSKEESDLNNCYRNGCNSYVRKPVEFEDFVSAVGKLGVYWLLVNEPPVVFREA